MRRAERVTGLTASVTPAEQKTRAALCRGRRRTGRREKTGQRPRSRRTRSSTEASRPRKCTRTLSWGHTTRSDTRVLPRHINRRVPGERPCRLRTADTHLLTFCSPQAPPSYELTSDLHKISCVCSFYLGMRLRSCLLKIRLQQHQTRMEGLRPALLHACHRSGEEPEGTTSWEPSLYG